MEDKNKNVVDIKELIRQSKNHWKLYVIVWVITGVISVFVTLSIPRYYTCMVELAPELSAESNSLSSLMNAVGVNGVSGSTTDAIYPYLYPDLMSSNEFALSLFDIGVTTLDRSISTTYSKYLLDHQKSPWWSGAISGIRTLLSSHESETMAGGKDDKNASFKITREQEKVINSIGGKLDCQVDRKTDVISISVTDQDPLICATVADTIMKRLQNFITEYRTKKARLDYDYALKLYNDAKRDYEVARERYAGFADSNWDLVSEQSKSKKLSLHNDAEIKLATFSTVSQQLQVAKAKVQENTPAFTIVKGPYVPLHPAGPHRLFIVVTMLVVSTFAVLVFIFRRRLLDIID